MTGAKSNESTMDNPQTNPGGRPPAGLPSWIGELNEQQQKAATTTEGQLLIVAGAGSGKTRVLSYRIAWLLHLQKALPQNILALTFTNKAAREMQQRVINLIGERAGRLWMGTFHSIFAKILRFEAEKLGFTSNFSIYDTGDSEQAIKLILDLGDPLVGRLLVYDALEQSFRTLKVNRDPQCPVCGEDAGEIVIAEYDDLCMPHPA